MLKNIILALLIGAPAIPDHSVTNVKLILSPAHTYKGNNTGSSATALDITSTQLTADLNAFTSSLQGLVPASGGGTTNYLRADGTFAAPAGSSVSLAAFGATPNSNGASVASNTLTLQPADATHPGGILGTSAAQTLAPSFTFSQAPVMSGGSITNNSIFTSSLAAAATAATASDIVVRDSNANAFVNAVIQNFTATATAGGTVAMSNGSSPIQAFTGSSAENLSLPDATTIQPGYTVTVLNASSGAVEIKANSGANLFSVAGTSFAFVVNLTNATSAGTWSILSGLPSGTTSGYVLTSNGTGSGPTMAPIPTAAVSTTGMVVGSSTAQTLGGKYTMSNAINYATATVTAAANDAQSGCAALTNEVNIVNSSTSTTNSTCLPAAAVGKHAVIYNATANVIHVFPASGSSIGAGAANAEWATTLVAQSGTITAGLECYGQTSTIWVCAGMK